MGNRGMQSVRRSAASWNTLVKWGRSNEHAEDQEAAPWLGPHHLSPRAGGGVLERAGIAVLALAAAVRQVAHARGVGAEADDGAAQSLRLLLLSGDPARSGEYPQGGRALAGVHPSVSPGGERW